MWANVTMQSKKMWTNVANVPKKGTKRNLLKKKKAEQNQKSIAACTINCWSNVTEKLIQCEQHIHTESEVSFGGYHECRLDCSHHCSIRNYGKNLKWRKNDLEERKSSNNRSSHFWLLTINWTPVLIIIIFNLKTG